MAVEAVVALLVDKLDKLLSREAQLLGVHGEINWIREELNQLRRFLKDADIKQKEDEDVRDWMEDIRDICFDVDDVIDILGQGQAAQGRHGFVGRLKRRISDQITRYKVGKEIERIKLNIKGISRSRESYGIRETSSTQRLQEVSRCSVPPKIEIVITTVNDQLTNEERTRDIDEGRQEASSSSRNLQAHNPVSTLPGGPEEVGLQEEINTVGQQLIEEEPRLWDGTRDISEGKLEASSSTPVFLITLLGDSEDVGLQEGINTVGQQLIQEEPGPYDGTSDIDEGRLEASSSAPCLQADRQFSTLLGKSEEVGLKEEIDTVSEQLIKEKPSPCDGTGDIDEVPKWRYGSKKRKRQPNWSERVRVSSGPGLEGPPDDGHSWRKYGQKDILGATYPRAYYRCAHRNVTGCAAKKQVQRSEEDPSIFHVTYQGDHTCNIQSSKITGEASLLPQPFTLHQPLLGTAPLYPEKGTMKKV
ncbi:putative WRKY transcription factor 53 [Cinnamomum micranthum f. kanehirae]|uniref:Putative WRKY transcription factor 53 n=1 Tax=Cinnamomum micranthum f. kanehirae TaxID=337451 RepID=A0A3S3PU37_9MAGN|nr:putative WRKY transcription factor 53 [Cinnamomum micranthum f. kanehirae]